MRCRPFLSAAFRSGLPPGRTDLILKPNKTLSSNEVYDLIHNEEYVRLNKQNTPLYKEFSYMLVSMECLLNSPYLKLAEKENLIGNVNLQMGKKESKYLNETIGLFSHYSQLWVDRNFSLDYCFKSILKVSSGKKEK